MLNTQLQDRLVKRHPPALRKALRVIHSRRHSRQRRPGLDDSQPVASSPFPLIKPSAHLIREEELCRVLVDKELSASGIPIIRVDVRSKERFRRITFRHKELPEALYRKIT